MAAPATRNLTILLTDIKGFTDKTSRKTRSDIQAMLDKHRELVLPLLESKGGRLVKTIGDAFLMVYESPTDAVLSGVAVQEALRAHNADKAEDDRLDVRIAINSGEVNLSDNDIFGEPVNITARINAIAEAGEVFFTEAVYLAMNKSEVPSSEVGLLQLKGIPEKIRVYKVRRESPLSETSAVAPAGALSRLKAELFSGASAGARPSPSSASQVGTRPALSRRAAALAIDILLVSIIAGFFSGGRRHESRAPRAHRSKADAKTEAQIAKLGQVLEKAVQEAEKGKAEASLGEKGIRIKSGKVAVAINDGGVKVNTGLTIKTAHEPSTAEEDGADEESEEEDGAPRHPWGSPFALVWFVYSLVFLRKWGATPGKRILRLQVVKDDGSALDKKQAFWRAAASLLSGYALGLGYLWALWDKDRRGWHDLLAGTRVVEQS